MTATAENRHYMIMHTNTCHKFGIGCKIYLYMSSLPWTHVASRQKTCFITSVPPHHTHIITGMIFTFSYTPMHIPLLNIVTSLDTSFRIRYIHQLFFLFSISKKCLCALVANTWHTRTKQKLSAEYETQFSYYEFSSSSALAVGIIYHTNMSYLLTHFPLLM